MRLLLSPHSDDAVLFAAFTVQRDRPLVVTVFDSHKQGPVGPVMRRRAEDQRAMAILGSPVIFLGFSDSVPAPTIETMRAVLLNDLCKIGQPEMVYAPAIEEGGHAHHNFIGQVARELFQQVTYYATYTNRGKSIGHRVDFEPEWALRKLQALASYESQIRQKNQVEHFLRDQFEYYQG